MQTVTTIRAVAVFCGLALSGSALADSSYSDSSSADSYAYKAQPSLYLGGFYMRPDSARSTTNRAMGWTIGAGIPLWRQLSLEANLFTANLDTGTLNQSTLGNSDFYQRGGGLDAVWNFGRQDRFNPFVLGGVGAVYNDACGTAGTRCQRQTGAVYGQSLNRQHRHAGNVDLVGARRQQLHCVW